MIDAEQLAEMLKLPKDEPGMVSIVIYKGTVYGVYHRYEDARRFAEQKFGESALMALDVTILRQRVQ